MKPHSLEACISLAEAVPVGRGNYRVLSELLIELRYIAKKAEEEA